MEVAAGPDIGGIGHPAPGNIKTAAGMSRETGKDAVVQFERAPGINAARKGLRRDIKTAFGAAGYGKIRRGPAAF